VKAASAIALVTALLASVPSLADTITPAPAASTHVTLAPPSVTSAAVLMARAFRPKPETCTAEAPGTLPVLAPARANQASCLLSPFNSDNWARCPVFPAAPVLPLNTGHAAPPPNQQPSYIVGDRIDGTENGSSTITGSAQLDQGDRRVTSDRMSYDSNTGIANVEKGVNYASPKMMLSSPSGEYNTTTGTGTFKDTVFLMPKRNGHGSATIYNTLDDDHSQLYGVDYTTCPPGRVDWLLSAPDMYLDTLTDTGEGHDVTIHFFGLPILWTPYINFPLSSERKSGFLGANFSFDVINGFEISTPYYLNLAEDYDAVLFPRIITKRGVQTGAEFRWLSEINSGMIYGDYLPHDQVAGRERSQFILRNISNFDQFNQLSTLYNWVSDDRYFRDLGSDLTVTSTSILPRHVMYTYDDEADWMIMSQFEDFQTIAAGIPPQLFPYRRLPQVVINWSNNEDITGPQYGYHAEAVRFQRELRIGTWRSDLKPFISLPISSAAAYFTPALAWRVTDYDLEADGYTPYKQPLVAVPDRHLSRSLPIFDIDTGLNFERDAGAYTQTLEPRLFYLRVPYRDQSQIPVFDSVQPEFGYLQLFSDNRFYGADRQGDANQLSYALTTRFLDSLTGAQVFQADVGQTRYFADRRVQLNVITPTDTSLYSDVVGDMLYNFNEVWTADYNQLWNPVTRATDLASVLLEYHPGYHEVLNLGYEFRRPNLKQTTVSFAWPLAGAWSWVGGWNYDVVHKETLERILGFEYDTCCWNFQIVNRYYLMPNRRYDSVFFFSLTLKGLGQVGRHLEDLLQRDILGYSNDQFNEPLQPEEQPTPQ